MKRPFFLKLFISYCVMIIALTCLILFASFELLKRYTIENSAASLVNTAWAVANQLTPLLEQQNNTQINTITKDLGRKLSTRITVISPMGEVIADSENDPHKMDNHLSRPEIVAALKKTTGSSYRFSQTMKENRLYTAVVSKNAQGKVMGIIRLSLQIKSVQDQIQKLAFHILKIDTVILLFSLCVALIISRRLTHPLHELVNATRRLAKQDFDTKIKLHSQDEYTELAESFNDMMAQLKQSFQTLAQQKEELDGIIAFKKDFVSNISHELRTPLTAINGFIETLEELTDTDAKHYLDIIKNNTARLTTIVEDLLTISELESKLSTLDLEPINVAEMIQNILPLFENRLQSKGLTLKKELAPVTIMGDRFRLEQALINLIDNAIKYTDNGTITITAYQAENTVVIEVADTGHGISENHLPRIFERFYVVDKSRSRKLGGTGLGLSIVKHIVLLHHGEINVQSIPQQGTRFSLIFHSKEG